MSKDERKIKFILASICIHLSAIICGILGAIPVPLIGFLVSPIIITISATIIFAIYKKLFKYFFKLIVAFASALIAMGCGGILSIVKYLAGIGTFGAVVIFIVIAEFYGWIFFLVARYEKEDK